MATQMDMARARICDDKERGMTLVELLVYMILLGLVLAIIGSLMINTVKKQTEVVRISESNNLAQTVVSSVDLAVANASGFRLRTDAASGSQLLITKTRSTLSDATDASGVVGVGQVNVARCVGYYYDAVTKNIHWVSVPLPSVSNTVKAADVTGFAGAASWPVLASGVTPVGPLQPRVFTQGVSDLTKVTVSFSLATYASLPPVTVQTTTGLRGAGLIDNSGVCWNG